MSHVRSVLSVAAAGVVVAFSLVGCGRDTPPGAVVQFDVRGVQCGKCDALPLKGATIMVGDQMLHTDQAGHAETTVSVSGQVTVEVSAPGLIGQEHVVSVGGDGSSSSSSFVLYKTDPAG